MPREHFISSSPPAERGIIKTNSPLTFNTGPSKDLVREGVYLVEG